MVHHHTHRRQARDAFAEAAADALADAFPAPIVKDRDTYVSVVYVTASKTFDGPIAGFTTVKIQQVSSTPKAAPTTKSPAPVVSSKPVVVASSTPVAKATSTSPTLPPVVVQQQTTLQTSSTGTDLPASIQAVSTSLDSNIPLLAAAPTTRDSVGHPTFASSSGTPPAKSKSESSSDSGMSGGAKAGMAIGIILLVGTALALALFFIKKRRNTQKEREQLSEKEMFAPASPKHQRPLSTRTTATAPRLSLRPVTQFIPNFTENSQNRGGNDLQAANTEKALPVIGQDSNRSNPFGNHAETIDSANANGPAVVNDVGPGGEFLAVGAAAGAGAGLARGASRRGAKPLDLTNSGPLMGPPSPTGTEFSMSSEGPNTPVQTSSSAAIAAAGGPANSSVHRVQLDFKPSMDDELDLHAGQLIRMLHEYDDGWALCIRLDRSRQGVVPRTCLSTRPVKPRPHQNGPRGPPPGMRGPQQHQQQRPHSPAMNNGPGRPMNANGGPQARAMTPNSQQGRPMTPQGCPMTPSGPQYKAQGPSSRPQTPTNPSTSMAERRNTPPSPLTSAAEPSSPPPAGPASGSVVRKPVGQAM